jgi:uncharacterized protein (DUF433 family)
MTIVRDDDVLGGEPRIEGTRIGVRHVVSVALDAGRTLAYVADQFDLSLAQVHEALAYYYSNPAEIRAAERENREAFETLDDEALEPKGIVR